MSGIDTFESMKLNASQIDDVAEIKEAADVLIAAIYNAGMQERYRSIAITQLEITVMVANKGVSRVWM